MPAMQIFSSERESKKVGLTFKRWNMIVFMCCSCIHVVVDTRHELLLRSAPVTMRLNHKSLWNSHKNQFKHRASVSECASCVDRQDCMCTLENMSNMTNRKKNCQPPTIWRFILCVCHKHTAVCAWACMLNYIENSYRHIHSFGSCVCEQRCTVKCLLSFNFITR